MCGYCTELFSIRIAAEQAVGKVWDFQTTDQRQQLTYYLQECLDLNQCLALYADGAQSLLQIVRFLEQESSLTYVARLEVIFCRVIEVLVKNGFESPEYQILISNPLINPIVRYEVNRPPLPDEQTVFPETYLEALFRYEVFTSRPQWEAITKSSALMTECDKLLNAYIDWWHRERDVSFDRETALEESAIFQRVYPLVFFSAMVLTKHAPASTTLYRLVKANPRAPMFEALELWLQRKVIIALHEMAGLTPFLPYDQVVRSSLIYYLVASNQLSVSEKYILREAIINSGRYDPTDTQEHTPFYLFIERHLMEYLAIN